MLSHVHYEGNSEVPTRDPLWTNKMNRIPRLSEAEKVVVTVSGKMERKKSLALSGREQRRLKAVPRVQVLQTWRARSQSFFRYFFDFGCLLRASAPPLFCGLQC